VYSSLPLQCKDFHDGCESRLETRTKEFRLYASQRAYFKKPQGAEKSFSQEYRTMVFKPIYLQYWYRTFPLTLLQFVTVVEDEHTG